MFSRLFRWNKEPDTPGYEGLDVNGMLGESKALRRGLRDEAREAAKAKRRVAADIVRRLREEAREAQRIKEKQEKQEKQAREEARAEREAWRRRFEDNKGRSQKEATEDAKARSREEAEARRREWQARKEAEARSRGSEEQQRLTECNRKYFCHGNENCTWQETRQNFKDMVRRHHPDKNPGKDGKEIQEILDCWKLAQQYREHEQTSAA